MFKVNRVKKRMERKNREHKKSNRSNSESGELPFKPVKKKGYARTDLSKLDQTIEFRDNHYSKDLNRVWGNE